MNPILILFGLVILALWDSSDTGKPPDNATPQNRTAGNLEPAQSETPIAEAGIPAPQAITVDLLREIFHGGARPLRRRDAVEILKAAPYFIPKTNAYRALAPSRRFAAHLCEDEQGWLHFTP